jgi:Asp/Glu/hydantoin racemase
VQRDGADVVILGGIGFAGLAERIAGKVPVPLIDNVVAAVQMAEAAAALKLAKPTTGSFAATAPVRTTGLSAELAALIEGQKK